MNLVVFSGFIGSGKTSILLSLARHLTQGASGEGVELSSMVSEMEKELSQLMGWSRE